MPPIQEANTWDGSHVTIDFTRSDFVQQVLEDAVKEIHERQVPLAAKIRNQKALTELPDSYTKWLTSPRPVSMRQRNYLNKNRCFACCEESDVTNRDPVVKFLHLKYFSVREIYLCQHCIPDEPGMAQRGWFCAR